MNKNTNINFLKARKEIFLLNQLLADADLRDTRTWVHAAYMVHSGTERVYSLVPHLFPQHTDWFTTLNICRICSSVVPAGDTDKVSKMWSDLVEIWVTLGSHPEGED